MERIDPYAFKNCTGLNVVSLPESLKKLGESAFNGCTGLNEMRLPAGLTEIGEYCFSRCAGLKKLTFTGNAPSICTGAFKEVTATACYPGGNPTWTAQVRQNYGGSIRWTAI